MRHNHLAQFEPINLVLPPGTGNSSSNVSLNSEYNLTLNGTTNTNTTMWFQDNRDVEGQACTHYLQDFKCAVEYTVDYINILVPLVIGIALLLFLFGLIKYVRAGADEKMHAEARNLIIWGIVGLFVMTSVWGLVNIITNTFFEGQTSFVPQVKGGE